MSTGPEHYQQAEAILKGLLDAETQDIYMACLGVAQVHATLALAAATVNAAELVEQPGAYDKRCPGDNPTWEAVTS